MFSSVQCFRARVDLVVWPLGHFVAHCLLLKVRQCEYTRLSCCYLFLLEKKKDWEKYRRYYAATAYQGTVITFAPRCGVLLLLRLTRGELVQVLQ